jgi:transposase
MADQEDRELELALKRVKAFILEQAERLSVTDAAKELSIARQTYYDWQRRGFDALLEAMRDRPAGRPAEPADTEKEALRRRIQELESALLVAQQQLTLRDVTRAMTGEDCTNPTQVKKKRPRKPGLKRDRNA